MVFETNVLFRVQVDCFHLTFTFCQNAPRIGGDEVGGTRSIGRDSWRDFKTTLKKKQTNNDLNIFKVDTGLIPTIMSIVCAELVKHCVRRPLAHACGASAKTTCSSAFGCGDVLGEKGIR